MTREEAINKLIRIRQVQGGKSEAHEALGMAIDALAYQAELPEGLKEAADKYAHSLGYDKEKERLEIVSAKEDFIAGAEWDRAKMMEKAVEGVCVSNVWVERKEGKEFVVRGEISKEMGFKSRDRVKIIVIPE